MSDRRTSTPVKFVIAYLVVLALMLGWWTALQASTGSAAPVLTVLVAYAGPAVGWGVVTTLIGEKRRRT